MSKAKKLSTLEESASFRESFVTVAAGEAAADMGHELLERALGSDLLQEVLNGRPPLGNVWREKGHRSPMFTFRLPDELADQFRDVVAIAGRPQSDILREAVSEYVKRHG